MQENKNESNKTTRTKQKTIYTSTKLRILHHIKFILHHIKFNSEKQPQQTNKHFKKEE